MTCTRELTPWPMSLTLTNTDESFLWDPQWYPCIRVLGASAAMSLKPAIQLAQVRTDRPAAGVHPFRRHAYPVRSALVVMQARS